MKRALSVWIFPGEKKSEAKFRNKEGRDEVSFLFPSLTAAGKFRVQSHFFFTLAAKDN
jgi:hypothetical protein